MNDSSAAIRLKHFLESTGLTNSQFADQCGIPRPTLSQLLSGRNKKLSDQVLRPIHQHFPSLSIVWLMFGEGDMLVSGAGSTTSAQAGLGNGGEDSPSGNAQGDLSVQPEISDGDAFVADGGYLDAQSVESPTDRTPSVSGNDGVAVRPSVTTANEETQAVYRRTPPRSNYRDRTDPLVPPRKVRSIVVYYDDNTYETFYPGDSLPGYL